MEAHTYKDKIYWDKTYKFEAHLRQKLSGPNQLEDQTYYGTKALGQNLSDVQNLLSDETFSWTKITLSVANRCSSIGKS